MKKMLFVLLLLPLAAFSQDKKDSDVPAFEGWQIKDCQVFALDQLTQVENGVLAMGTKGRITPKTKTIYISKQKWLQNLPDTMNGYEIKYVDIPANVDEIAKDVKKNDAAVYYLSPFEMKSTICEMWVFPVNVKKGTFGAAKQEYCTTSYLMKFFFNYDPPKYEFRGVDAVMMDE